MLNGLAAVLAAVIYYVVAVRKAFAFCDFRNGLKAFSDKRGVFGIYLICAADMLLGQDKNMHRRLGIYIAERENILILVNLG